MTNAIQRTLNNFRGTLRLSPPSTDFEKPSDSGFHTSGLTKIVGTGQDTEATWLQETRKLIPGEALAGYLSLQPVSKAAEQPEDVRIVLAIVFCIVTIVLKWVGSQDPEAEKPYETAEIGGVLISTLSFIFLVYSTGGQIFWHPQFHDQALYGQIFAAALGILGPAIHRKVFAHT